MWSSWIFKGGSFRSPPAATVTSKMAVLHRESIRESEIVKGIQLITSPSLIGSPDDHVQALEKAGLTVSEVQEVLSRIMDNPPSGVNEMSGSEYDPIYLLPPPKYEEFVIKLTSNTNGANSVLKSLKNFVSIFKDGIGTAYSMEDKANLAVNQTSLLTDVAINGLYNNFKNETSGSPRNSKVIERRNERFRRVFTQAVSECVEKCLMTKLHEFVFPPAVVQRMNEEGYQPPRLSKSGSGKEEQELVQMDEYLHAKIEALQEFILPKHLDLSFDLSSESAFPSILQEMQNMNQFKSPRDKLLVIVKASKTIFSILTKMTKSSSPSKNSTPKISVSSPLPSPLPESAISADLFLPALIFCIIKANPISLKSNAKYIQAFRNNNKMMHESGYLFVSFMTAVTFIERLSWTKLSNVTKEEYDTLLEKVKAPEGIDMSERMKRASTYTANDHLLNACASDDLETVQALIEDGGVDPCFIKLTTPMTPILKLNDFPLSVACRYGNLEIVEYLLTKAEVNVDMKNDIGRTALHSECTGHRLGQDMVYNMDTIQLLLKHGASLDEPDRFGNTPFSAARNEGVVALLESHRNDPHKVAYSSPPSSPLHGHLKDHREIPMRKISSPEVPINVTPPMNRNNNAEEQKEDTRKRIALMRAHMVKSSDSLFSIAEEYQVPPETLRKVNNMEKSTDLDVLSHIIIPLCLSSKDDNQSQEEEEGT
eukprot:TRINITY_DN2002_c0_g1_i1.p1 TRINITY_DN2002_c0_g1~~TRINITY_DN2002_c0_g1_i1.p1  ORF type:complete len:710 (-),score=238.46 TRINITY_DN2002_c0_g1_i1:39-2168(-)